jgi:hypothetical protein
MDYLLREKPKVRGLLTLTAVRDAGFEAATCRRGDRSENQKSESGMRDPGHGDAKGNPLLLLHRCLECVGLFAQLFFDAGKLRV